MENDSLKTASMTTTVCLSRPTAIERAKAEKSERGLVKDGVRKAVLARSESELLLENACSVFEKESRKATVLKVCEYKKGEVGGADPLAGKRCMEVKVVFLWRRWNSEVNTWTTRGT